MVSTTTVRPSSAAAGPGPRGGGLADAAGAAADDDPVPGSSIRRVDLGAGGRGRRCPASGPWPSCRAGAHAIPWRHSAPRARRARRGRRLRRAGAARTSAASLAAAALLSSRATRLGVLAASRPARRRPASRALTPAAASPAASSAGRAGPWRHAVELGVVEQRRAPALTTIPPTGRSALVSSATPSAVSCTGISSSSVTMCTAVIGERSSDITESAWLRIGPTGPARDLLVDVQEPGDPPGRRRVEHHRVVHACRALAATTAS